MNPSSEQFKRLRVCLVHDWLIAMRGGERVLEALCEMFPPAPIYTLFYDRNKLSPLLQKKTIHASFLQFVPGVVKFYRWLLPIFPLAVRSFDLSAYDVVVSISHCVAKSVRIKKGAIHICYCNAPMRYAWDFADEYFGRFPPVLKQAILLILGWLREWDRKTADEVTYFIGNSANIAAKIKKHYGREAARIYPAVDLEGSCSPARGDYFLSVGALVPYKRIDLAVEAFNKLKLPLRIVGEGPARGKLEQLARHPEIKFEGWLDEEALRNRYRHARALIFPGEEDFGIVPLEAQVFGKPVIAFGKGGVLETVIPNNEPKSNDARQATGIFFYEQTAESLAAAVTRFLELEFDPAFISAQPKQFSRARFKAEFLSFLESLPGVSPAKPVSLTRESK